MPDGYLKIAPVQGGRHGRSPSSRSWRSTASWPCWRSRPSRPGASSSRVPADDAAAMAALNLEILERNVRTRELLDQTKAQEAVKTKARAGRGRRDAPSPVPWAGADGADHRRARRVPRRSRSEGWPLYRRRSCSGNRPNCSSPSAIAHNTLPTDSFMVASTARAMGQAWSCSADAKTVQSSGRHQPAASQEGAIAPTWTSIIRDVTVEKRNERAVAEPGASSSWQRRPPTSASGT